MSLLLLQTPAHRQAERDTRGRYRGIDSIRGLCAATVVLAHVGIFSSAHADVAHVPALVVRASALLWNGPAAVIVFFIISGFCIHLPYRGHRPLLFASYLPRRLLRIGVPALCAMGYKLFVLRNSDIFNDVLWSVFCELIYYILYPALRRLAHTLSWGSLIAVTYLAGLALIVTHLQTLSLAQNTYMALGPRLTWVLGLPCWLMGCWLAENVERLPQPGTGGMWTLRAVVFAASVALRALKFHVTSPFASNCLTLNIFALLAAFWIGCEIRYFENSEAPRLFEWAGSWSYSLYLVHPLVAGSLALLGISWMNHATATQHLFVLCSIFPLAYLYFLVVEKPSHLLAVRVSRQLAP